MDLHDFSDMGSQIKNIVQDAIDTRDFEQLSRDINRTINQTFHDIGNKKGFYYTPKDQYGNEIKYTQNPDHSAEEPKTSFNQAHQAYHPPYRNTYGVKRKDSIYDVSFPVKKNPPGSISGIVMMSVGIPFAAMFGIAELVLGICSAAIPDAAFALIPTMSGLFPPFIISLIVSIAGGKKYGRIRRFKSYLKILKEKSFCTLKDLGAEIGKSAKYIYRDLNYMIEQNYFPEGHIDEQKTCFMATNDLYQQYLLSQESLKARTKQQTDVSDESREAKGTSQDRMEAFQKILQDGKHYRDRIREANDAIPDTEISNKLYRMEIIVGKIFEYVAQHPEQIDQLRRFIDYYMPTTDKLVNAYKEFDTQPIQGDNIKKAKDEIAKTLDTINEAYEKLYDSMYVDVTMDVSSDIAVLQTLLAQEGLTQNAFEKKEDKLKL